jgi:zona occludens toxin
MIYLTSGGNGAGKTLFTLADVRAQQLKENRPVYYHGFEPLQPIIDFGWLPFDPKKWQDLPDGSICVFDECQNEFPAKIQGEIPDYINAVAQFRRKRGFDFWMITPHPTLLHINIRRLIENPSWHRHMKRTFGADMVSELKFSVANTNCEKPSAGASAQVKMRPFPKEVYPWYKSSSLHTGKKKIPKQVYVLVVLALLIPALFYFAFQKVTSKAHPVAPGATAAAGVTETGRTGVTEQTPADYVATFAPRVEGLAYTASRYDEVTKPTTAPYPAACINMGKRCECYTQQGTGLPVPLAMCQQIVKGGFFMDWQQPQQSDVVSKSKPLEGNPGQATAVPAPAPSAPSVAVSRSSDLEALAANRRSQIASN